jgi:hypothetical protein
MIRHPGLPNMRKPLGDVESRYIPRDVLLCRIYRNSDGHSPLSYNPTIAKPYDEGGRWDRIVKADSPFMYGSVTNDEHGSHTALVETLRPIFKPNPLSDRRHLVMYSELANRSVCMFRAKKEIRLVSTLDVPALRQLNAEQEVVIWNDRSVTRRWSHYWQRRLPEEFKGIAYNSTLDTFGKGNSFVVWGDRLPEANTLFETSATYRILESPFRKNLDDVLRWYGVDIAYDAT